MSDAAKALAPGSSATGVVEAVKARGKLLAGSVALLWLVQVVNAVLGHALDGLGVVPRTLSGLAGIVFAPFLHASFAHLLANTTSLVLLGFLVSLRKTRDFARTVGLAALTAGLGTWLVGGAHTVHIGASGVIFGLLGFLLSRGVFEKKLVPILGSIAGLFLFGGALRGLFPGMAGISWEAHLFGFLGGILAARLAAGASTAPASALPSPGLRARFRTTETPARGRIADPTPEPDADEELEALKRRMER